MVENESETAEVENQKKMRKYRDYAIVGILVLIFCMLHIRLIRCGNDHLLLFVLSPSDAWTLIPKTLHTRSGDIKTPLFTPVFYEYGHLTNMFIAEKKVKHNIIFMGNKLNTDISSIEFNEDGYVQGFDTGYNPQRFVIDGVELFVKKYVYRFWDDIYLLVYDFTEIILMDGTKIQPGSKDEFFVTLGASKFNSANNEWFGYEGWEPENDEWEMNHHEYDYFLVTLPNERKVLKLSSITFEPHWGKIISYKETKIRDK